MTKHEIRAFVAFVKDSNSLRQTDLITSLISISNRRLENNTKISLTNDAREIFQRRVSTISRARPERECRRKKGGGGKLEKREGCNRIEYSSKFSNLASLEYFREHVMHAHVRGRMSLIKRRSKRTGGGRSVTDSRGETRLSAAPSIVLSSRSASSRGMLINPLII